MTRQVFNTHTTLIAFAISAIFGTAPALAASITSSDGVEFENIETFNDWSFSNPNPTVDGNVTYSVSGASDAADYINASLLGSGCDGRCIRDPFAYGFLRMDLASAVDRVGATFGTIAFATEPLWRGTLSIFGAGDVLLESAVIDGATGVQTFHGFLRDTADITAMLFVPDFSVYFEGDGPVSLLVMGTDNFSWGAPAPEDEDPHADVPLPAGGWLILSGLAGLVAMRRRRDPPRV